jgi:hypothetical protein
MANDNHVINAERIACEICMKEVPRNEAISPETDDYVAYFCGLDCYDEWKNPSATPEEKIQNASA